MDEQGKNGIGGGGGIIPAKEGVLLDGVNAGESLIGENSLSPNVSLIPGKPAGDEPIAPKLPGGESAAPSYQNTETAKTETTSEVLKKEGSSFLENKGSIKNEVVAEPSKPEVKLNAIRTYQSDVAKSIIGNKTSVAGMVMAEQNKKQKSAYPEAPKSKKNILLITISLILLLLGVGSVVFVLSKPIPSVGPSGGALAPSLIFAESERRISVTGTSPEILAKEIGNEVTTANNKLDTVKNLYFSENDSGNDVLLTTQRFFFFLDDRMPPTLLRSLDKNFMFGIHTFNGNHPFLLLQTEFYENAFAGMLGWEQYMARDLFPMFGIKRNPDSGVFIRPFIDMTVKNRDARVLKDDDGKNILFYVFKDKKTLIITDSENTLEEVTRRLNSSNPVIR